MDVRYVKECLSSHGAFFDSRNSKVVVCWWPWLSDIKGVVLEDKALMQPHYATSYQR